MQLAEFVTYLADRVKVAPVTIKTYMAAVRSLHVEQGFGDPFAGTTLPHRVFTGVKRVHGTGPRLIRLPITLAVLRRIIYQLQRASWLPHIDQLMIGAACSLAFFGFMRLRRTSWPPVWRCGHSTRTNEAPRGKLTNLQDRPVPARLLCVGWERQRLQRTPVRRPPDRSLSTSQRTYHGRRQPSLLQVQERRSPVASTSNVGGAAIAGKRRMPLRRGLQGTQLQEWSSDNGRRSRSARLADQDDGALGVRRVPDLHKDTANNIAERCLHTDETRLISE